MEAPAAKRSPVRDPPENPRKRRRRSRFASSVPSPSTDAAPSHAKDANPPSAPSAPSKPPPPPNASVAALRARLPRPAAAPPSDAPQLNQAPTPKRRRTGRSRFSQLQSPAARRHVAQVVPPPAVPKLPLDVTAIPVAPVSTLRINRDAQKQRKLASVLKVSSADLLETDPELNPYYDASIAKPANAVRQPRKEFVFIPQGDIVAKAGKKREEAQVQAKVAHYRAQLISKERQESNLPVLPPHIDDLRASHQVREVPQWEWWDLPFLANPKEAAAAMDKLVERKEQKQDADSDAMDLDCKIELKTDRVTHYIHHPPPIESTRPKKPPPALPLMLTKKETKKLRRKRRMEAQKEQQEMVAVGLLPPPKPKVKLSNLVRVLANEASADPTKVEEEVRAQVEARRRKHEMENEARKKTKEERREKVHTKIAKDREAGMHAAVFRITDIRNPQHRFKIDINARQWEMTGTLLSFGGCNVVVAEGGLKALRKYKKLMLRRIDWNAKREAEGNVEKETNQEPSAEDHGNNRDNSCLLVWEGPIASNAFKEFNITSARTQRECRYHFRKHGVEHYWDLCTQGTPLGNENLGVKQIE